MTVAELIKALQDCPQDIEVYIDSEEYPKVIGVDYEAEDGTEGVLLEVVTPDLE